MDRGDPIGIGDDGLGMPASPEFSVHHGMEKDGIQSLKTGSTNEDKVSEVPKRFKSSFIFFSMEKHKEIKVRIHTEGALPKSTNITKMVSEAWRSLLPEEKAKYERLARDDKARYDVERANYKEEKGNSILSKKKQRDPLAPKRPMSAFLAFANSRRAEVKAQNSECSNGEISKLLSDKWKDAPEPIKKRYRDDEAALWAVYKEQMVDWRKKNDGRKRTSKALVAAVTLKLKKERKSKPKSRSFEEEASIADNSFDDPHFGGFGPHGLESGSTSNQDDIMAASLALRGVRAGPGTFQFGMGTASSSPANIGSGGVGQLPLDSNMQQNLQQGAGGNYNAIFGMNSMNSYGTGASNSTGNSASGSSGFVQDTGNPNTNRALLEMSFPYQQYGSYAGMFGNNAQAMIMAQAALRGNPASYLGFTDQQPPLSQLASLAGSQNSAGNFGQSPVSMGIGLGFGGTGSMGGMSGIGGMNSMGGIGGMGGVMNDNSNNRLGSDGMMNNAF